MTNEYSTVAVLMSTYNGEKYLKEQIDSILGQQEVQMNLYIRDDGSTDATIAILSDYGNRYKNINLFINEGNLGPGKSFMSIFYRMRETNYDYYAFADQDDIWLPSKLIHAIEGIESYSKNNPDRPILYGSNQIIYQGGQKRGLRYSEPQDVSLISRIDKNTISGCTFVFNQALMEIISKAPHPSDDVLRRRLHDGWVMLCAIICGDVIYDENAYILYRIHKENVVGVRKLSPKERIGVIRKNIFDKHFSNYRKKTAEQLLKCFPEVKGKNRATLEKYAHYQDDFKHKEALMNDDEIVNSFSSNKFVSKLKILFNLI